MVKDFVLSDRAIRHLKGNEKSLRLWDHKGLYLEISKTGTKSWRFKYRFDGIEKRLSLGQYPEISLLEAREKLLQARRLIFNGIDPSVERKTRIKKYDFQHVALEWINKKISSWGSLQKNIVLSRLERFVFPFVGQRPINEIRSIDVVNLLKDIEKTGKVSTAHRTKFVISQIFDFAVVMGLLQQNPVKNLNDILQPVKTKHFAALLDSVEIGKLLKKIDSLSCSPGVKAAMQLAPMFFARPGELRLARWVEIDFDSATWKYRITKTEIDHVVPLCKQAIAILKNLHLHTGHSNFVFASKKNGYSPIGEKALNNALVALGTSMTPHGWRATARTLLDETLGFRVDIIEAQLGHAVKDSLGRAYNRTTFLLDRRIMMQKWGDFLEDMKNQNLENSLPPG